MFRPVTDAVLPCSWYYTHSSTELLLAGNHCKACNLLPLALGNDINQHQVHVQAGHGRCSALQYALHTVKH